MAVTTGPNGTPTLDGFSRGEAAESPLSNGGQWNGPIVHGDGTFHIPAHTEEAAPLAAFAEAYWAASEWANAEAWATIKTFSVNIDLWLRLTHPGVEHTEGAYMVEFTSEHILVYKVKNGALTVIETLAYGGGATAPVSGDSVAATVIGNVITAYTNHSGTWVKAATFTDKSTEQVTGSGFIGMGFDTSDTTGRVDTFGGGALNPTTTAFIGATGSESGGLSYALSAPPGAVAGDLLIGAFEWEYPGDTFAAGATITPPAGWNTIQNIIVSKGGTKEFFAGFFWTVYTGSGSPWTWTATNTGAYNGTQSVIVAYSGVNQVDNFSVSNDPATKGRPVSVPAITTTHANELVVMISLNDNGQIFGGEGGSPPAGWEQRTNEATAPMVFDKIITTPGSTGAFTDNYSSATGYVAMQIGLISRGAKPGIRFVGSSAVRLASGL